MSKRPAVFAGPVIGDVDQASLFPADGLDLDGVAERRERFLAHAAAASQVVTYEFAIPDGAMLPNAGGGLAASRLELVLALTGGAVTRFPGGLAARVPLVARERFEALAKPLIEAFLIAWRV